MKRLIDVVGAIAGLFVLAPVILILAALIYWKLGRPIVFRQQRPGLHGLPFMLVKFRTMTDERDEQGEPLPDAERLTRFGRALRATSLDELPELWHVLRGDMSLVGPRPLLMDYLSLYTSEQARRHEMRPGLTGLAQISGRNGLSWDDKLALDVWYVDNWSVWLDLKLLWRTLIFIVRREGIAAEGEATMPRFKGSGHHQR